MIEIVEGLLIVLLLGAFVGLQFRINAEEKNYTRHAFAGMRTCIAITLLGYLVVLMSDFNELIYILFTSFFLLLVLLSYVYSSFVKRRPGGTSETTLALLFLVGNLIAFGEINLAIIITIIISIISSGHKFLYQISDKFTRLEVIETLKFGIIIFLVLPLLPREAVDPLGVINPYDIWLMVILISGISYIGYMASKFIKKKQSILLTGFVGGLVSSIAVSTSMAMENNKRPKFINTYTTAILLASTIVFVRVFVEVFIINRNLIGKIALPLGAMFLTMSIFVIYAFIKQLAEKNSPKFKQDLKIERPFALAPALKFGVFFVVILFLVKVAELYLGNKGIYLSAIISSLADIDAISISLSKLSADNIIAETVSVRAITIAVIANTLVKLVYIHMFGNRILTKKVFAVFTITSVVGIATAFLV